MEKSKEELLLEKYLSGEAGDLDKAMVESWYLRLSAEGERPDESVIENAEAEVWARLQGVQQPSRSMKLWQRITVAASVVLCLGIGVYVYQKNEILVQARIANIVPGKNAATLTLSDGRKVSLSAGAKGSLAEDSGIKINKTADGQISYDMSSVIGGSSTGDKINTLSTGRGEQYQVRLPDGSKVWLNAASTLSYPASSVERGERWVKLSGEAYFEVAKDAAHPFIVKTALQEVQVLGTHFNISSYNDEPQVKTTLLEGSVKILQLKSKSSGLLKPGQQSVVTASNAGIEIGAADTDAAIAWKNGDFYFENERMESIMKQIGRWYNVGIEFRDPAKKEALFGGYISRSSSISKVLRMLEHAGIAKFSIENNTIIIK